MALINLQDISLSFGGLPVLDGLSIQIQEGDKIGLLGRNGSGKSSLMKIIEGSLETDAGTLIIDKDIKIARMPQGIPEDLQGSIADIIQYGTNPDLNHNRNSHAESKHLHEIDRILSLIKLDGTRPFETLSVGMKRRTLLGHSLFNNPDILLLDEPTNDLDLETVELLEEILLDYQGTLLLVSHDRAFLNNVVTSTLAFEGNGIVKEYVGDYDEWLAAKKIDKPVIKEKKIREKKTLKKIKLSFKENKELEELPALLEEKEQQKNNLITRLADPNLYQQEGELVPQLKEELAILEEDLEKLFSRFTVMNLSRKYGLITKPRINTYYSITMLC